ncbi:DUF721 domain-containing protein [Algirhabdus cladophorae]|uniref:DUF721 domain-containing protein n=1 Tax=Algirhabdus cladophorae TaxID=3377108 RepID=UPI003B848116
MPVTRRNTSTFGFKPTSDLLQSRIRKASETRGFAVSRLLTHWAEIVGVETAEIAHPVNVSYGRGGLGATLTVLTTGAQAPMLQVQLPKIREKVNACYGYNAIAKVRITQTAPTGFAEGQIQFRAKAKTKPALAQTEIETIKKTAQNVQNDGLRNALEALGANVMTKSKSN